MVPLERLGDRRAELRFEIIGDLWATLVTTESLPLVNLSAGGVLVECAGPLAVGSAQRLRLTLGEQVCDVAATVRHVTPVQARPDRYLVGMQFAELTPKAHATIDAFIEGSSPVSGVDGEA